MKGGEVRHRGQRFETNRFIQMSLDVHQYAKNPFLIAGFRVGIGWFVCHLRFLSF